MTAEKKRLYEDKTKKVNWKKWGPYITERQWGTVREDYSENGDAWSYLSYEQAQSKAYRWGEDGIGGISDENQLLAFSVAFWNKRDPIIKERLFGLAGPEGNHGEDVKEIYYYLDCTPTHSYMKMLYKCPQAEFPYKMLYEENHKRGKNEPEFELIDTGIFDDDKYFDVFIEYAKAGPNDILIRITTHNRGSDEAELIILPQVWFRNTWSWGYNNYKPLICASKNGFINIIHTQLGEYKLYFEDNPELIFCENETNSKKLYGTDNGQEFFKDGINNYIVNREINTVNPNSKGTKAGLIFDLKLEAEKSKTIYLRLVNKSEENPFENAEKIFTDRILETDEFFEGLQEKIKSKDKRNVQRQAYAGLLWSKQFYYYDVPQWLNGDPTQPPPSPIRKKGRNSGWEHLNNADIISMPDKWEYPWYAAWDLAFHCIPLVLIDAEFAKEQLLLFSREWYMHPNGQLPAYEWNFSDVNPPVHAWATWRVYKIDEKYSGNGDIDFLEKVFHKLLLNFTWWANKKDEDGNNIFQGGFLGMDNIGVFDRSNKLPTGGRIDQSDGTSWMAMFSLNMLRISLELARTKPVYQDLATKFFEHFLYIAGAMTNIGGDGTNLWDEEDQFYYDVLHFHSDHSLKLKIRSMVGLIPLFAVEVLDPDLMEQVPEFENRMKWFLEYRPDLASLVSRWYEPGSGERRLLSLLRGSRMKKLLKRMLDETEFLSDYGIRSLSKYHDKNPYTFEAGGEEFNVKYIPGESDSNMFGGNSNWRGPIWFPVNYLIIESLQKFYHYYSDDFKIEYPTNSGNYVTINDVAKELSNRLANIFLRDENGIRPVFGNNEKLQKDPHFKDYIFFNEYFSGENGRGLGASHQTGWTALIAKLLQPRKKIV